MSFDERITRINRLIKRLGKLLQTRIDKTKLKKLEEWMRNRLRYCIWHHWKKPGRKRKNLIRFGINQDMAYS